MGIQVTIKSIGIGKDPIVSDYRLNLSVEVAADGYRPGQHAPRIEVFLENQWDNRRFVLPVSSFKDDPETGKAVCFATYTFFVDYIFWDCKWKDCSLSLDVEYNNTLYERVPFTVEFSSMEKKNRLDVHEDYLDIHMEEEIDSLLDRQPNALQAVLAVLLKVFSYCLAFLLIPFFALDAFCMLTLHAEYVDHNLKGSFGKRFIHLLARQIFSFCRNTTGVVGFKTQVLRLSYLTVSAFHPVKKGVLFLSNRRNDMTGNIECVYEKIKNHKGVPVSFWLHPEEIKDAGLPILFDMAVKMGRARVIVTDDYVSYFQELQLSRKTTLVQLWHACGAFKTFGFSRTGKVGGPRQTVPQHRNYNYAFVSSSSVAKYYAEGFGLAREKVLPYGVPRTDIFWDREEKERISRELYRRYPMLENKKIILFAPTFRGAGKNTAFYEKARFEPNRFIEALPGDYILLIKHHPFVDLTYRIKEENADRIFDFSRESEINHLLFITDVLITDYSSVVYEASILNIPMVFFAYDLEDYISSRDFYTEYEYFVPGKIVRTQEELTQIMLTEDFGHELVKDFCERNFDLRDGKASERIAGFILEKAKSR